MKRRVVKYTVRSQKDAAWIFRTVASGAGADVALAYLQRIREFCDRLEYAAERGNRHDHLRAGLRVVGFEKRISVAFRVSKDRVTILRIFYGGRDWKRDLR